MLPPSFGTVDCFGGRHSLWRESESFPGGVLIISLWLGRCQEEPKAAAAKRFGSAMEEIVMQIMLLAALLSGPIQPDASHSAFGGVPPAMASMADALGSSDNSGDPLVSAEASVDTLAPTHAAAERAPPASMAAQGRPLPTAALAEGF